MRLRASALSVLLIVGAGLAACGDSDEAPPAASKVEGLLVATTGAVTGDAAFVQLPEGRVDFVVSPPTDEVSAQQAMDHHDHRTPDGQTWIGVAWTFTPGAGVPGWQSPLLVGAPQEIRVRLRSGDTTDDLGTPRRTPQTPADVSSSSEFFAPVGGSGQDVTLEITYDGLTQTVDARAGTREAGAAGPLYDPAPQPLTSDCSAGSWVTRGGATVSCGWWQTSLAYVAGLGWAGDEPWTVVSLGTDSPTYRVGPNTYRLSDLADSSRLEGDRPAATLLSSTQGTKLSALLVFAGGEPGDSLVIARKATGLLAQGPGRAQRSIRLAHGVVLH